MTEFRLAQTIEYRGYIVNEVFAPLPKRSHASVVWNDDDSFTAFIDPNDSYEAQEKGILHELDEHINGLDFSDYKDKDVNKLEMAAHHVVPKPVCEQPKVLRRWEPSRLQITLETVCWVMDIDLDAVLTGRIEPPEKPNRRKFEKLLKEKLIRCSKWELFDMYFKQAYDAHERRMLNPEA